MVHIENVSFGYPSKPQLFEDLSVSLPLGNIYGLLGKNGAGKSSLLKLIAGLLFPRAGSLHVGGCLPKERHPEFLSEIYLVTEEFEVPAMGMKRFVDLYSPFYPRFNQALFQTYLNEFSLPTDEKLTALSYGQKKKFLLSFGLATDCQLLILDEPTNGLDIPSKSQFRKVVASAIHEERSFIISTHQARDMENLIDPIIILDEGQIVFFEDYEQISKKLTVSKVKTLPPSDQVVYSESNFSGYTVVEENRSDVESNMNLEILFNAVVNNTKKVQEIFKNQTVEG
ncbi:ABC-2 type transport system ATP-binding protein [Reichenbachiella faecimaris]|uniref:ABC-2 type transport system ATP-binding protein n=1 Tax=Reichenbachiella faecimaris TaxID=692418 RepID=A0A1W2G5E7_REIFA|nr:ABC transporter ATP-binding protein [Reichenbachiella faecimaris]SMD31754.1 ABC-2 type transport system ATP-binding protein [Reichenbachiella faecimaris]